jgi:hypothetical protein
MRIAGIGGVEKNPVRRLRRSISVGSAASVERPYTVAWLNHFGSLSKLNGLYCLHFYFKSL